MLSFCLYVYLSVCVYVCVRVCMKTTIQEVPYGFGSNFDRMMTSRLHFESPTREGGGGEVPGDSSSTLIRKATNQIYHDQLSQRNCPQAVAVLAMKAGGDVLTGS